MSAVHPPACPACCIVKFTVNIARYILANKINKNTFNYIYICLLLCDGAGAAIIGGGGTRPPNILVGGRKGKCPPADGPFSKIFRTYFPFG